METAGRRVAQAVLEQLGGRGGRVAVVCGAGNNGGDGYVVARCLREHGIDAAVFLAAPPESIAGDARIHFDAYERTGGVVLSCSDAAGLAAQREAIESSDMVVDAVFGTGLTREVTGHYRAVLEVIAAASGVVLAVDIPSGLSADTGLPLGVAVRADVTVTMAFLKVGLAVAPGYPHAGRVTIAEIGIPRQLAIAHGVRLAMVEAADVAPLVPPIDELDHKNRRGHLLVVAGSPGKRGAGRLAAMAGLRAGAGLVTLAAHAGGGELVAPDPVMTAELDAGDPAAGDALQALAAGKRALAIGPGMPVGDQPRALIQSALESLDIPVVIDADALNQLAGDLGAVARANAQAVLTPHPGEAARLLGSSTADVERDRVGAVRRLAEATRAVVVLKGARTLVCDTEGLTTINPTGNPGLATAGSGDVLTGVIGGLCAQGLPASVAARLGVYVHGLAGDRVRDRIGPWGMAASDLVDEVALALGQLRAVL
jgi:NAD(P)H-hydrate epimerase